VQKLKNNKTLLGGTTMNEAFAEEQVEAEEDKVFVTIDEEGAIVKVCTDFGDAYKAGYTHSCFAKVEVWDHMKGTFLLSIDC
jgi:hypothetical protein